MSVREYIGSRYVPLFADPIQWSNQNTYEPLTIVVNQGNSYTSRQFVPVGIDISNTEYWALTGNYNAQVEQYRQEVENLQDDVDQNTNDITNINNSITDIKNSITNRYMNSKAIFICDSWGTINYGVTKPFMMVMADILGISMTNLSVGATGYIQGGSNNYLNRLTTWVKNNPSLIDDIDYVFVEGSSNDYQYSRTEISAAILNFVNYALNAFPNAQIIVIPQFGTTFPAYGNMVNASEDNIWRQVNTAAYNFSYNLTSQRVQVLDGTFFAMRFTPSTFMNSDNVHPTQIGHNYLGKWLAGALLGKTPMSATLNQWPSECTAKVYHNDTELNEITVTANYMNLQIINNCIYGTINFTWTSDTSTGNNIKLWYPGFVKQAFTTSALSFGYYYDISNQNLKPMYTRMLDTGIDVTSENRGSYINIQALTLSGGSTYGFIIPISSPIGYPNTGANIA